MSKNKNLIAVTMGDPSGIGTEITIKAWIKKNTNLKFFLIHDPVYVSRVIKKMKVGLKVQIINNPSEALSVNKKYLPVIPIKIDAKTQLGERNYSNAGAILQSIDMAIDFAKQKVISGIVTNPINKEVIAKKLMRFKGHTEYLAKKDKKSNELMFLLNKKMKVIPVTTHIALKDVAKKINKKNITKSILNVDQTLKKDFGVRKPKIAVSGLNPHSGDGGILGKEEILKIIPAINECKKKGINVSGPYPADSLFRNSNIKKFDSFICMYHDQALIPIKVVDFDNTVNYTAGLSFVRTSPDHGTGLDIAKKFVASCDSLLTAIGMALNIAKNRGL